VQPNDVASFEWDDSWLDFVHFNPEHGKGREASVDLFGVEEQVAFDAVRATSTSQLSCCTTRHIVSLW
jgi:hypothetical protein